MTTSTRKHLKRLLMGVSGTLLALVVLILVATYWTLYSTAGTTWAINTAAERAKLTLNWREASGNAVQGLHFSELRVASQADAASQFTIHIEQFESKWSLFDLLKRQFELETFSASGVHIGIHPSTEPEPKPSQPPSSWPTVDLPIDVQVNRLALSNVTVALPEQTIHFDTLHLSAQWQNTELELSEFAIAQGLSELRLAGTLETTTPYTHQFELEWILDSASSLAAANTETEPQQYAGNATFSGDLKQLHLRHQLTLPVSLLSEGQVSPGLDLQQIQFDSNQLAFELNNQWQIEDYPLPDGGRILSSHGRVALQGGLQDYQLDTQFDLLTDLFPEAETQHVRLMGDGNLETFRIELGEISGAAGNLTLAGDVSWSGDTQWQLTLDASAINPAVFAPEWPGNVSLHASVAGQMINQQPQIQVALNELGGTLRGYTLSGRGSGEFRPEKITINHVELEQGNNQISLQGELSDQLDAQWQLVANDLSHLYPGLAGAITSTGNLSGSRSAPRILINLKGDALSYMDVSVGSLSLEGNTQDLIQGDHRFNLELTQISSGGQTIDTLHLSSNGSLDEQQFTLTLNHPIAELTLEGLGQWQDPQWLSEFSTARVDLREFGVWTQNERSQVNLAVPPLAPALALNAALGCWTDGTANWCLDAAYSDTGVALETQLNDFPLAFFQNFLPPDSSLGGVISLAASASGPVDDIAANASLRVSDNTLVLYAATDQRKEVPFRNFSANLSLEHGEIAVDASGQFSERGELTASLATNLNTPDAALQGKLNAAIYQLAWLDPFLTIADELSGSAELNLSVAGTRAAPQMTGEFELKQLTAYIPEAGILVRNGNIGITQADTDRWNIQGHLESGEGYLDLGGYTQFSNAQDWQAEIEINGQDLDTVDMDIVQATLSPALRIQASPELIDVTGTLTIPKAQITVASLPVSTTSVSGDAVVYRQDSTQPTSAGGFAVSTDLQIELGDEIFLEGFGVEGRLDGALRLRQPPADTLELNGTLEIREGTYQAYGQDLSIESGSLTFLGSPTSPLVNVRAVRQVDTTQVGIEISGTPSTLASDLFSSPSLPQTDTLALLITGRTLSSDTSSSESDMLINAVASLGVRQGASITQRLQSSLGVDVLEISTKDGVDNSNVTIGKYLTPDLFVSYLQQLTAQSASLRLEYSLTDSFKIRAESGETQSLDLQYLITH